MSAVCDFCSETVAIVEPMPEAIREHVGDEGAPEICGRCRTHLAHDLALELAAEKYLADAAK